MLNTSNLKKTAIKIINTLTKPNLSQKHIINQIKAQIILKNHLSNTKFTHQFIAAISKTHKPLLLSYLPLFLSNPKITHVFTFNLLIQAFSHSHTPEVPFFLYKYMVGNSIGVNNYTYPFVLKYLSDIGDLVNGKSMHTHVVKLGFLTDVYVGNGLLDLYASCGEMGSCHQLFDEMSDRDVVSWTVLIMGYKDLGRLDDALIAFEQMQYVGIVPNHVTMVNALAACAGYGAIEMGVWIHEFIKRRELELDVVLGTSLIDMYMKCGRIQEGFDTFRAMKEKNVFTWNVIIKGLAFSKCGHEAIQWFKKMEQEGYEPDEVSFVNVLSACSHSGLVRVGKQVFTSLIKGRYGFMPNSKHYACMIDLFARAGCVNEALNLVEGMPFEATSSMWGSILAGCRAQGNLELSELAAKKLVELEPQNSAYHVLLSNVYAEMGKWSDVSEARVVMKDKGLTKDMGCSCVEHKHFAESY